MANAVRLTNVAVGSSPPPPKPQNVIDSALKAGVLYPSDPSRLGPALENHIRNLGSEKVRVHLHKLLRAKEKLRDKGKRKTRAATRDTASADLYLLACLEEDEDSFTALMTPAGSTAESQDDQQPPKTPEEWLERMQHALMEPFKPYELGVLLSGITEEDPHKLKAELTPIVAQGAKALMRWLRDKQGLSPLFARREELRARVQDEFDELALRGDGKIALQQLQTTEAAEASGSPAEFLETYKQVTASPTEGTGVWHHALKVIIQRAGTGNDIDPKQLLSDIRLLMKAIAQQLPMAGFDTAYLKAVHDQLQSAKTNNSFVPMAMTERDRTQKAIAKHAAHEQAQPVAVH